MKTRGFFITLEGTDGVGKSTQGRLLVGWLKGLGKSVVVTREPGGGAVAESLRSLLLDPRSKITDLTELFLYEAARADHVQNIVRPALKKGAVVVCDRYTDATVAYQGHARGLSLKTISQLNAIATQGLEPDLTIWLDLPAEKGLKRARGRTRSGKSNGDRMENQGAMFQKRVRRGYLAQAKKHPRRIVRVPVLPSILATQNRIRAAVEKKLHL